MAKHKPNLKNVPLKALIDELRDRACFPALSEAQLLEIREIVAETFGLTVPQMLSSRRLRRYTAARQVYIHFLRKFMDYEYAYIATLVGFKDHTSVLYAYNRVEEILKKPRIMRWVLAGYEDVMAKIVKRGVVDWEVGRLKKAMREEMG